MGFAGVIGSIAFHRNNESAIAPCPGSRRSTEPAGGRLSRQTDSGKAASPAPGKSERERDET
jgi:hypothetical protein